MTSVPGLAALGSAADAVGARVRRARSPYRDAGAAERWSHTPTEALVVTTDDGVDLHVEIDAPESGSRGRRHLAGRAPTVVLVHGFALTMQSWVLQRRALIHEGLRVVSYDQRGHGRSGHPDLASCTVDRLGKDLAQVLAATCGSGPVVLIGHSMGGMSVMSFAGQHPDIVRDRVLAVALVSTSSGGQEVTQLGLGPMVGKVVGSIGPGVLTRLSRHAGPIGLLRKMGKGVQDVVVERWAFDSPVSPALVDLVAEMIFDTSFEVMAAFLPHMDALDLTPSLGALHGVETLVMNGSGDLITPASHSEEILRHVPGAEHVLLEDAGHIIMLEHPGVVTDQLLKLVRRAQRAVVEGVDVSEKPRVRRTIRDMSKKRRGARPRRGRAS
ncbi:alpha/beta fold hydrolase [uncultured Phycicoccus sp.]|uniref:alpha/beta fold hydrolase n=1 Tax=uncultured Phycicoccus sp. TaxID=661422 RepID=UPI002622D21B|nr:alpha/beta hydrolase [uncultured Phycicoccus sp.]